MQPTLFVGIDNSMSITQQEIIEPGPVRPGLWRPGPGREPATHFMYAGVGTKPA